MIWMHRVSVGAAALCLALTLGGCGDGRLLKEAETATARGDWREARDLYQRHRAQYPDSEAGPKAQQMLDRMNEWLHVKELVAEAEKSEGAARWTDAHKHYGDALSAALSSDYPETDFLRRKLLEVVPKRRQELLDQGERLLREGNPKEALRHYEDARKLTTPEERVELESRLDEIISLIRRLDAEAAAAVNRAAYAERRDRQAENARTAAERAANAPKPFDWASLFEKALPPEDPATAGKSGPKISYDDEPAAGGGADASKLRELFKGLRKPGQPAGKK